MSTDRSPAPLTKGVDEAADALASAAAAHHAALRPLILLLSSFLKASSAVKYDSQLMTPQREFVSMTKGSLRK